MVGDVLDVGSSLKNKVIFITGGTRGIGYACVKLLRAHGAKIALTYPEGYETAATTLELFPDDAGYVSAHALDLRSATSIKSSMQEAFERWGRLDILVNNAAVGSATVANYAAETDVQDSVMLTINADGTLKMCQTFLKLMQAQLRHDSLKIINISSVGGGIQIFPGFRLSDGMSKAAVAFLTKQLAAELLDTKVDVFALCPGATNTKMFQESTLAHMSLEQQKTFIASLPKGRLIEPHEIAQLVVFLASSYSTPLHGAVIDASMGLGVRPGRITELNL